MERKIFPSSSLSTEPLLVIYIIIIIVVVVIIICHRIDMSFEGMFVLPPDFFSWVFWLFVS